MLTNIKKYWRFRRLKEVESCRIWLWATARDATEQFIVHDIRRQPPLLQFHRDLSGKYHAINLPEKHKRYSHFQPRIQKFNDLVLTKHELRKLLKLSTERNKKAYQYLNMIRGRQRAHWTAYWGLVVSIAVFVFLIAVNWQQLTRLIF